MISNRVYGILRALVQLWLPAAGTLVFTLEDLWHFAYTTQIVGTIAAVTTVLGGILRFSSQYKTDNPFDGHMIIDFTNPSRDLYRFDFKTPLELIPTKDHVKLKVRNAADQPDQPSAR